jgi:hypothetical protein
MICVRRTLLAAVAVCVAVGFVVPVPTVVARNCSILVIDQDGKPWPNFEVKRGWAYGYIEKDERSRTGGDGRVVFSAKTELHSYLDRIFVSVVDVVNVHEDEHITDDYLTTLPDGYTAEIKGDTGFKPVYEPGHLASFDLSDQPRDARPRRLTVVMKPKRTSP